MVVADFQLRDSGAFLFGSLNCGYLLLDVAGKVAQLIKLRIIAAVYYAAVLERCRRLILYGGVNQRFYVIDGVNTRADVHKQRRLRARKQAFELRQVRGACREGFVFPRACVAENNAGHHTLEVIYAGKLRRNVAGEHRVVQQRLHRVKALVNFDRIKQRAVDVRPQKPPPHGRVRLVEHPKQRAALFAAAHGFGKLQITARGQIKLHKRAVGIELHA